MTARGEAFQALQIPDMERRVADMVKLGTVSDTDYSDPKAPRVKVKYGKNETGWLPWAAVRAGRARTWEPLKMGEQVVIVSPSGDLAQGIIVGSVNYNDRPAPSSKEGETVREWDGGAREVFDDDSNSYTLTIPAGGKIKFQCGASTLELTDTEVRVTTTNYVVDAPDSTFTGNVLVQKMLSFLGGLFGRNTGGAVADMQGTINHTGGDYVHSDGEMSSNGVVLDGHQHSGVQPGGGNTGNPVK